jgi:hypothetical protein
MSLLEESGTVIPAAGGGGAWTPSSESNVIIDVSVGRDTQYEEEGRTTAAGANDPVGSLTNAASANHFSTVTASARPTYISSGIFGRDAIQFKETGSNSDLNTAAGVILNDLTLGATYGVSFKYAVSPLNTEFFNFETSTTNRLTFQMKDASTSPKLEVVSRNTDPETLVWNGFGLVEGVSYTCIFTIDTDKKTIHMYRDGVELSTSQVLDDVAFEGDASSQWALGIGRVIAFAIHTMGDFFVVAEKLTNISEIHDYLSRS